MKDSQHDAGLLPSGMTQRRRRILQFTLAGAFGGLIVGLVEAALLFFVPRVPTLLKPDTDLVIWTLPPLFNSVLFGLTGGLLGLMAAARNAVIDALPTALLCGLSAGHVAWVAGLLRVQLADLRAFNYLETPAAVFALVVTGLMLAVWLLRRDISPSSLALHGLPVRAATRTLAGIAVILLAAFFVMLFGRNRSLPHGSTPLASAAGKPNIVLITLDTARADHLSVYGYHRPTSSNLEQLARRGVLFESAMAPSSWTLPSHASIFTGLLPHQHGANSIFPLPGGPRTLAEILGALGYETAGFNSNIFYGQEGWGLAQGFAVYQDDRTSLRYNVARTVASRALAEPLYYHGIRPDYYFRRTAGQLNRDIMRWVKRRSSRPYFLFINYFDAHYPYQAPGKFSGRFGPSPNVAARRPDALYAGQVGMSLSAGEQDALIVGYDNSLAYLDEQVGKLVNDLGALPGGKNTVFIITSDHGEAFGEHGTYDHGWDLYREVLHVPLVITGPGVPAGLRISHLVRLQELFPTILEAVLGGVPPFDRLSLRRFWTPGFQPDEFDDMAIAEVTPSFPEPNVPMSISLMTSEWHYIHKSNGHLELYQWRTDPQERMNLAGTPGYQSVLHALRQKLFAATEASVRPWDGPEYLFALDGPGYSYLRDLAFRPPDASGRAQPIHRLGACQMYFARDATSGPHWPAVPDADLLESLPYH